MKSRLQEDFLRFIGEHSLFGKRQKVLLAVSGGIDSVVMCRLFSEAGFTFALAHVNFGLRGSESDEDETFVSKLARTCRVPFFKTSADTKAFGRQQKISVQMAARELRYAWLEEVRKKEGYHVVAVAHHLQDVTETILINLLRGTGIAGLHGMLPVNGHIIRPLLFAAKAEINAFAHERKLKWREDSSNDKDDYTRNLLRHKVLPVFARINPSYEKTFGQNAKHFTEAGFLVSQYIENIESSLLLEKGDGEFRLPKIFFQSHPAAETILFELLKKFDFTPSVVHDILRSLKHIPGSKFLSSTHQLLLDREAMVLTSLKKVNAETEMKEYADHLELINERFVLHIYPLAMSKKLYRLILSNTDKNVTYADVEKMKLPMAVRTWKRGDSFFPFGMNGKKKVSDFYTDLKLSLTEKERTFMLTDAEKIIWIMGYRMDRRIAITPETKFCYRFEFNHR